MLSEEFLKTYREAGDCFPNLLARATYLSKFCRDGESWTDTVKRVVEDNVSKDPNVSEDEAKELFDAIWYMRVMPPGRGLWTGGVPGMHPAAKFNCWGTVLDSPEEWCWTADMLMLGGGVGVSLLEIDKLPIVKGFSRLYIGCSSEHPNVGEVQPDYVGDRVYSIPDSREGWVDALRTVLAAGYSGRDARVDVTGVRERGAPIRTFGGVACGPGPLVHLLRKVNGILNGAIGRRLTSVECLDITNYVGLCIRSGNVRRSALIVVGQPDDQAFRDAKKDFAAVLSHRSTSNNSIAVRGDEEWMALVHDMSEFGEPGILNFQRAWHDDEGAVVVNPCGEIFLHKREACCLVEFFPSRCESLTAARRAAVLATRYCLRQRLDPLPDAESNAKQKANMRLGVAIGGVCDFDWNTRTIDRLYLDVRIAADDYALELGVNAPIAVTCIKPSGCRPADALTTTTTGILTMPELFELHKSGDEWGPAPGFVVDLDGRERSVTKTYDNGVAPVVELKMSFGLSVKSTLNHKWWVVGRGWVEASDIAIGDVIDVKIGTYQSATNAQLKRLESRAISMKSDSHEISQPEEMTPDLGWLLGYLWGDGAMSPSKYRIRFVDQHRENLEKAQRIILDLFGIESKLFKASENRNALTLDIASKHLWHWLIKNDVWKYFADQIDEIPRVVRHSSTEVVVAFLAGLVDSDGCVTGTGKVIFTGACESFMWHMQHVAWSVGFPIGRSLSTGGENLQAEKRMWHCQSSVFALPETVALLHKHSTKLGKHELTSLNLTSGRMTKTPGRVESIVELGEMETFDIEVEGDHWYRAGSVKSHNTISLLVGASPGMHAPFAPYYIRRARFASNDPMVAHLVAAGVPMEPDQYDQTLNTLVASFPIANPGLKVYVANETVDDQIQRLVDLQNHWADNAVSATVSFEKHEELRLAELLAENIHDIKSVSCLPKAHGYTQAPYEEITKEQYESLIAGIDNTAKLTYGGDVLVDECAGGACPVR